MNGTGIRSGLARYLQWRSEHWTEGRLDRHQTRRINSMLRYVQRNSPYYQDRLVKRSLTLSEVPMMSKTEMMAHFDDINTAGLHREELIAFRIQQERRGLTDIYPGGYAIGLSSGTSGNKVLTVLSRSERSRYAILLLARSGVPLKLRNPRVLFALRTNNPAFTAVTALGIELHYVDYFVPIPDLVDHINRDRLNVIAGPPSLLAMLAESSASISSPIHTVISYAEELDDTTRRRLAECFQATVVEIYQGAEGMLGFTCRAGSLHLSEDTTFVELLDAGDTLGTARRVVVTDLYRRTQPFLRYELNDLLEVGNRDCPCGSAFRRINRIHGRRDSTFILKSQKGGTVRLMPDYVRRAINQASPAILEYQAIQHSLEEIEVRLDLAPDADLASITSRVQSNLRFWADRAGGILGRIKFTDLPPQRDPTSHKLIRVISEVPHP